MARKGQRVFEPISTPLEDDIPLPITLVGTKGWFDSAFEEGAVDPGQCLIISSPGDLAIVKEWLDKRPIVGCDTETTGPQDQDREYAMNPINADSRVVLLQLGTEEHIWVIEPALIPEFKTTLENPTQLHLAHNWLYDFKWLLVKYKIHVMNMYCSMLAEQVRRAGLLGYKVNLAECARRYKPYWIISKAVRSLFIKLGNGKMTREMIQYAARDVPLLFPVNREQTAELKARNLTYISQLEMDIIPCTAEMEAGGVYLNKFKLGLLIRYWLDRQEDMESRIIDAYNERRKSMGKLNFIIPELKEIFDLESNKEKKEALANIGIQLDDVKRSTLLTVDDPLARMLGEYSGITKMTSTYGNNMLKKINEDTEMWYPRFAQMGSGASDEGGRDTKETTATGRYVSDAQQFPRKAERYAVEKDPKVYDEVVAQFSDAIEAAKQKFILEKTA